MGRPIDGGRIPGRGLHSGERLSGLWRFGGGAVGEGARQACEVGRRLSGERQDPSQGAARGRPGAAGAGRRGRFVRGAARAGRRSQRRNRGAAVGLGQGAPAEEQCVPALSQHRRAHGAGGGRDDRGATRRDFDRALCDAQEVRRAPGHDRGGAAVGQRPLRARLFGLAGGEGLHAAAVHGFGSRGRRVRLGSGQRHQQRQSLRTVHGRQHGAGQPRGVQSPRRHAQQRQHAPGLRRPRHAQRPHHRRLQRSHRRLSASGLLRLSLRPGHRALRQARLVRHLRSGQFHQPRLRGHDFAGLSRRRAHQFRQLGRGHLRRLRHRRPAVRRAGPRRAANRFRRARRGQSGHDHRVRRRQRGLGRGNGRLARHGQERHHRRRGRERPLARDHQRRQQRHRRGRLRHAGRRSQQRQRHRQFFKPRSLQRWPQEARDRRPRHARHRRRGAASEGDGRQRQRHRLLRWHGRVRPARRRHRRQHEQLLPAGPAVVQHLLGHQPFDARGGRRRRAGLSVFPQPEPERPEPGDGQGLFDECRPVHDRHGRGRRPVVQRPGHGHDEPRFRV